MSFKGDVDGPTDPCVGDSNDDERFENLSQFMMWYRNLKMKTGIPCHRGRERHKVMFLKIRPIFKSAAWREANNWGTGWPVERTRKGYIFSVVRAAAGNDRRPEAGKTATRISLLATGITPIKNVTSVRPVSLSRLLWLFVIKSHHPFAFHCQAPKRWWASSHFQGKWNPFSMSRQSHLISRAFLVMAGGVYRPLWDLKLPTEISTTRPSLQPPFVPRQW